MVFSVNPLDSSTSLMHFLMVYVVSCCWLALYTDWSGRAKISRKLQQHQTQRGRSLVQGDGLAQWHFNQPSQSFLTNEYVSVWPERACVIFPSFYHKDAGRHSRGIRSTLCGDRQTGSANKMECLCISHLSVNIQIPLPTGTVCVCVPSVHEALF